MSECSQPKVNLPPKPGLPDIQLLRGDVLDPLRRRVEARPRLDLLDYSQVGLRNIVDVRHGGWVLNLTEGGIGQLE